MIGLEAAEIEKNKQVALSFTAFCRQCRHVLKWSIEATEPIIISNVDCFYVVFRAKHVEICFIMVGQEVAKL